MKSEDKWLSYSILEPLAEKKMSTSRQSALKTVAERLVCLKVTTWTFTFLLHYVMFSSKKQYVDIDLEDTE